MHYVCTARVCKQENYQKERPHPFGLHTRNPVRRNCFQVNWAGGLFPAPCEGGGGQGTGSPGLVHLELELSLPK